MLRSLLPWILFIAFSYVMGIAQKSDIVWLRYVSICFWVIGLVTFRVWDSYKKESEKYLDRHDDK